MVDKSQSFRVSAPESSSFTSLILEPTIPIGVYATMTIFFITNTLVEVNGWVIEFVHEQPMIVQIWMTVRLYQN